MMIACEDTRADVTRKRLDVTDAMSGRQVAISIAFRRESFTANVTRRSSLRTLNVCRIVVTVHAAFFTVLLAAHVTLVLSVKMP